MHTTWFPQLKYISAGIGLICFVFALIIKPNKITFLLPVIVYVCMIFSAIYTGNHRLEEFVLPLMFIGPSLLLIDFNISYRIALLFFWVTVSMYTVSLSGLIDLGMFQYYSKNYVSINVLNLITLLYISMFRNNFRFSLYPSIAVAVVCYLSMGRASIIVCTIQLALFFLYLLYYRKQEEHKGNFFLVIFAILVLLAGYLIVFDKYVFPLLQRFSSTHKFDYGFTSVGRSMLLREYLYRIKDSFGNLLFGVPIRNNALFLAFGSNWHSSYLRLHSFFGLSGVLVFFASTYKAIVRFLKENKIFLILLFVLLLRIATDSAAANGIFDPLLYYFFVQGWKKYL